VTGGVIGVFAGNRPSAMRVAVLARLPLDECEVGVGVGGGVMHTLACGVTVTVPDAPVEANVSTEALSTQLLLVVNVLGLTDSC